MTRKASKPSSRDQTGGQVLGGCSDHDDMGDQAGWVRGWAEMSTPLLAFGSGA